MEQNARKVGTRLAEMHAGRRFGDVLVSMEADEELVWLFNDAGQQIDWPSIQGALFAGRHPGHPQAMEARAEALHAARKIWGRLQNIGAREGMVLEALYTERVWPRALVRRLGHLIGVVEAMTPVRAEHVGQRMLGRTTAASTTDWLEELVAARSEELRGWREDADRACGRALAAYQRARGAGPSVVPPEGR
jgi:hypothetical protein